MSKDKKEQRTVLAWIDLETTGLDEKTGRILEYAVVCTDLELGDILYMDAIIPQNVAIARSLMDDYVINMHTDNGLLVELEAVSSTALQYSDSVAQAEDDIMQLINSVRMAVTDYQVEVIFVIAGNTIGFDKRWIKAHMPRLFNALHYRQLDVSSYKVGFPDIFGTQTSTAHRAMDDIRDSIAQQQVMRDIVENSWKYEELNK